MYRRELITAGFAGLATIGFGGALFTTMSRPALAASLTAADVSVTKADGDVTSVYVAPDLSISWSGFEEPVDQIEVGIYSRLPDDGELTFQSANTSGGETAAALPVSSPSTDGSMNAALETFYLREGAETLPLDATTDGSSNATSIDVKVAVEAVDTDQTGTSVYSNGRVIERTETVATFTLTVTNEPTVVTVGGTANTGAN